MNRFSNAHILARRSCVILLGILLFPFVCVLWQRKRFYSYLSRIWLKTGPEPLWLTRSSASYQELC
ncbi:DUF2517 family protein [Pseudaeromonas sharmana]|uniref:DUF2517 family protein n=1 Tax=Pseudaeromonas sharmana TaxID=328412 RepID=A0ABV8CPC9_9GAMM